MILIYIYIYSPMLISSNIIFLFCLLFIWLKMYLKRVQNNGFSICSKTFHILFKPYNISSYVKQIDICCLTVWGIFSYRWLAIESTNITIYTIDIWYYFCWRIWFRYLQARSSFFAHTSSGSCCAVWAFCLDLRLRIFGIGISDCVSHKNPGQDPSANEDPRVSA